MILSIDTSTAICSVALHQQDQLLAATHLYTPKATATALLLLIEQLLDSTKTAKQDLEAIAVGKGPGSYTGLRIATSTAKGMCYALNIPLIGIDSLTAMAWHSCKELPMTDNDLLLPMIDARRMEVYTAVYSASLEQIEPIHAHVIEANSFNKYLEEGKKLWLFGNGAMKVATLISHPQVLILDKPETSAEGVGALAWERWQKKEFEDLAYFEPFYLKEFRGNKTKGHKLLRNIKEAHKH